MYEMGLIIGFVIFGLPLLIPAVYVVGVVAMLIVEAVKAISFRIQEVLRQRRR